MKYLEKFLKGFLKDRRGVTPVVGVILMVAVTVVMGAVIGGFVYGYIGTTEQGPLAGMSVKDDSADNDSLLIKHTGGEPIDAGDWKLSVTVGGDSTTQFEDASSVESGDTPAVLEVTEGELSAGRTIGVAKETDDPDYTAITTDTYHVVIVHIPSNAVLMDTNVTVR